MAIDASIEMQVQTALADYLKRKPDTITREHSLRDDLGLDSMAIIELLFRVEEIFNLQVPDEDIRKLATVGDVIAYVEGHVHPTSTLSSDKRTDKRASAKKKG